MYLLRLEFHPKVLAGLEISFQQFVDLCILCGCDYCGAVKGVGPKTALNLVRKYGNLETIIQNLDTKKHELPKDWLEQTEEGEEEAEEGEGKEGGTGKAKGKEFVPSFVEARQLFLDPDVADPNKFVFKWMVRDHCFRIPFRRRRP